MGVLDRRLEDVQSTRRRVYEYYVVAEELTNVAK
jgi:hypothetical protein